MMKSIIVCLLVLTTAEAVAGNAWYWGQISSIRTTGADGSFELNLENDNIKRGCKWDRVYFRVEDMGVERTKAALSLALTAFTSEKEWGVVIDIPRNTEGVCDASSTASQGAGIR